MLAWVMMLAAWLLHSIRLAAALGTALRAMQAPTGTREYQAALLQLVRNSDQDIAQRKASAQRVYGIAPEEDEQRFLGKLRAIEPSTAETLAASIERERSLRRSYERIDSFTPQLDLSFASAVYGLAGLLLGSLIGELATAAPLPRHPLAG